MKLIGVRRRIRQITNRLETLVHDLTGIDANHLPVPTPDQAEVSKRLATVIERLTVLKAEIDNGPPPANTTGPLSGVDPMHVRLR